MATLYTVSGINPVSGKRVEFVVTAESPEEAKREGQHLGLLVAKVEEGARTEEPPPVAS